MMCEFELIINHFGSIRSLVWDWLFQFSIKATTHGTNTGNQDSKGSKNDRNWLIDQPNITKLQQDGFDANNIIIILDVLFIINDHLQIMAIPSNKDDDAE